MADSNVDGTDPDYTRRQLLCTLGLGAGFATENQVSSTADSHPLLFPNPGIIPQNYRNDKTTQIIRYTLDRKEFEQRYRQILNDDPKTAQKIMGRDAFERYYDGQATEFVTMNILYRPDKKSPSNSKLQVGLVQAGEIENINNVPPDEISYSGWQNVSDTVARRLVPESALTPNSATSSVQRRLPQQGERITWSAARDYLRQGAIDRIRDSANELELQVTEGGFEFQYQGVENGNMTGYIEWYLPDDAFGTDDNSEPEKIEFDNIVFQSYTATSENQATTAGEITSTGGVSDTVPLARLVAYVVGIGMSAIVVAFAFWIAFKDYMTSDSSSRS